MTKQQPDGRPPVLVTGEEALRLTAKAVREMDEDYAQVARLSEEVQAAQRRLYDRSRWNLDAVVKAMGLDGDWRMDASYFKDLRVAVLMPDVGSGPRPSQSFQGIDLTRVQ